MSEKGEVTMVRGIFEVVQTRTEKSDRGRVRHYAGLRIWHWEDTFDAEPDAWEHMPDVLYDHLNGEFGGDLMLRDRWDAVHEIVVPEPMELGQIVELRMEVIGDDHGLRAQMRDRADQARTNAA